MYTHLHIHVHIYIYTHLHTYIDHNVVLMVQTAEGSRVQETFLSSVTLWEVLQHLKLDNVKDPAIIYMRQQSDWERKINDYINKGFGCDEWACVC